MLLHPDAPWTTALFLLSTSALSSCQSGDSAASSEPASAPSVAAVAVNAALKPAPEPSVAATRPRAKPQAADRAQLLLNPEQRQRLETAYPEARGFIDLLDVEEKLYRKSFKRDVLKPVNAALDGIAAGKWVLFAGNLMNPKPEGFELAVRYIPRDSQDLMGFSSAWLNVRFENVKGFVSTEHKAGDLVAILAQYNGKQVATPGYDVVALETWVLPKLAPKFH